MCGKAILIADGDITSKGARVETYSSMLGDRFLLLEQKEIENLIPPEVLAQISREGFAAHGGDPMKIKFEEYFFPAF